MRFRFDFAKKSCQLGLSGEKVWTIRGKLCGEILHWNVFSLHMNARAASRRLGERRSFAQGPLCFVAAFLETLIRVPVPPPSSKVRVGALKSANSRSFSRGRGSKKLRIRRAGMRLSFRALGTIRHHSAPRKPVSARVVSTHPAFSTVFAFVFFSLGRYNRTLSFLFFSRRRGKSCMSRARPF